MACLATCAPPRNRARRAAAVRMLGAWRKYCGVGLRRHKNSQRPPPGLRFRFNGRRVAQRSVLADYFQLMNFFRAVPLLTSLLTAAVVAAAPNPTPRPRPFHLPFFHLAAPPTPSPPVLLPPHNRTQPHPNPPNGSVASFSWFPHSDELVTHFLDSLLESEEISATKFHQLNKI